MNMTKPYNIPKSLVWNAFKCVKENKGTFGVDLESIEMFEKDISSNLYKLWNRLSSGSYFPPAVKGVAIPKKSGGVRMLGIPTVSDRIAQTVVKLVLEPMLEPVFHENSYGYRPKRSAHDAIAVVRRRNWEYDWVIEFDIKGLFDNINHELLLRAVKKHCKTQWILLYIGRWLKAPMQDEKGNLIERDKGTPQGGVVSPLLANLFLHYAFDMWVSHNLKGIRFCRYADDGVVHCESLPQAQTALEKIKERFYQCGLELNLDKTRIVYCKDSMRRKTYPVISYTFLGYTFRPRGSKNKYGRLSVNFLPAVSREALTMMRQTIRRWRIQLKSDKNLKDLSSMFNPIIRGWFNYYGKFYASAMFPVSRHINTYLVRWLMHKYKHLKGHKTRAATIFRKLAQSMPKAFVHWGLGCFTN